MARFPDVGADSSNEWSFYLFVVFIEGLHARYPRPVVCLVKHPDILLTIHDFQAELRVYLRTTNPVESTFVTVQLPTGSTKGRGSRTATLTVMFRLTFSAWQPWPDFNGRPPGDDARRDNSDRGRVQGKRGLVSADPQGSTTTRTDLAVAQLLAPQRTIGYTFFSGQSSVVALGPSGSGGTSWRLKK